MSSCKTGRRQWTRLELGQVRGLVTDCGGHEGEKRERTKTKRRAQIPLFIERFVVCILYGQGEVNVEYEIRVSQPEGEHNATCRFILLLFGY